MLQYETLTEDELIARYMEENPHKPSRANYRLVESGTPIWVFIGRYEALNGDAEQIAKNYDISMEQVAAAIAYYKRYKEIIDDRRMSNMRRAELA